MGDISATFQKLKMIERDQETGRFKIVRPRDLIEKHKEKEAKSNRHRIDENKLKWTPLGPEIINEEQLSDADDEEDEQLAKVIEESKQNMETPKITEKKKRKRKKGMKGDYDWGARKKRKTNSNASSPAPSVTKDEFESDNE